ncbi:hypothetical protein IPG41_05400 [Candidatus Peregrinibacteria bacterium]|nr:MAG: hypothetical protein IPG41_05400 [Candidatus Peregrinibacteria bacterium]
MELIGKLLKNRFFLFFIFIGVFIASNYYFSKSFLPSTQTEDLWFYSGIFMVLFSVLFIEPYYSSPRNVITNVIPLLLVFLSVESDFVNRPLWWIAVVVLLLALSISLISIGLQDENKSPEHIRNRLANFLKNLAVIIGKGKVIYSAVFFLFLYVNIDADGLSKIFAGQFMFLLVLWGTIMAIDPNELTNTFSIRKKVKDADEIGVIFGVQSKKCFW